MGRVLSAQLGIHSHKLSFVLFGILLLAVASYPKSRKRVYMRVRNKVKCKTHTSTWPTKLYVTKLLRPEHIRRLERQASDRSYTSVNEIKPTKFEHTNQVIIPSQVRRQRV